jgi:hypothetical protein
MGLKMSAANDLPGTSPRAVRTFAFSRFAFANRPFSVLETSLRKPTTGPNEVCHMPHLGRGV